MIEQMLVEEINRKRRWLTEEYRQVYDDMLVYLRLAYNTSSRETEEMLLELLEHLLEAQQAGKPAREVFGDDPRQLADQIAGQLPPLVPAKWWLMIGMGAAYFLAAGALFAGLFDLIMYVLGRGDWQKEVFAGSLAVKTLINLLLGLGLALLILHYLRWSCFRQMNKIKEFLLLWMLGMLAAGLFIAVWTLIPHMGPVLNVPVYVPLILSAALFAVGYGLQKRF